jgi:DNA polymerase-3 subunit epsilon
MPAHAIRSTRFAFVDVETTGINPATSAVVEVACQVVDRGRVVASFESLVDPGMPIPPFVTAIHGIDDAMVAGRPRLSQLVAGLVELCSGAVLVAHNAAFDRRFLPFLANRPSVCSWRLATRVVPEAPNHKNQTLRSFLGGDHAKLRGRRPHRALADVIVTRHVFFHCVDRYLQAGNPDEIGALREFVAPLHERRRSA